MTSGVTGLEIDQGVGPVSGTSTVVYPTGPTTYTLTASNSSGSDDATAEVILGTGGGPLVEDGLPPSGIFGVSLSPSDFQSDQTGEISSPSDERIVRVAPGGSFYALVSYSDLGGVAGVNIFIANSSPPGLRADLVQGQSVGGFTLVGEVGGCVLDGTQTTVNCIYQIQVGDIPNITALPGAGGEFAYVFRVRVTDAAGNVSDTPPRGYVIVGESAGGGDGGGGDGGGDGGGGGDTPTNRNPSAAFTNTQTASDSTSVSYRFSAAGSTDPDGDTLSYTWTFGDGTGASTRDHTKKYTADGTYTVRLTVSDGKGGSDTETKTVAVNVPGGGSGDGDDSDGGGDDGGDDGDGGDGQPTPNEKPEVGINITSGKNVYSFAELLSSAIVTVSGANSTDEEDDAANRSLSYQWSLPTKPQGSNASLASVGTPANPALRSLTPDKIGRYVINLKVTDSSGEVDEAQQTILVSVPSVTIDGEPSITLNTGASQAFTVKFDGAVVTQDVTDWSLSTGSNVGGITPTADDANGITYKAPNEETTVVLSVKISEAYAASTYGDSVNITVSSP